jgi:hypothetical protein
MYWISIDPFGFDLRSAPTFGCLVWHYDKKPAPSVGGRFLDLAKPFFLAAGFFNGPGSGG